MNTVQADASSVAQYDIIIVGAGLSGSVIAARCAEELGKRVLVLERRDHVGGICYDYIDEKTGVRASRYGPHLFHTDIGRVWDFVQKYGEWISYEHRVYAWVDDKLVPIPVNITTVQELCDPSIKTNDDMVDWLKSNQVHCKCPSNGEEAALAQVGHQLYEKIFKNYTKKQWNKYPKELDASVLQRIPVRADMEDRYFTDRHQALPKNGYTAFFETLLTHSNIDVSLATDFFSLKNYIDFSKQKVFYTGPIDHYFRDSDYEPLEYRSIRFEEEYVDEEFFQEYPQVNYPGSDVDYTRIVEYKHFPNQPDIQKGKGTLIVREYSLDDGDPFYPVPTQSTASMYEKYRQLAERENNVVFLGRLASYKYYNMDQAIMSALNCFDETVSGDRAKPTLSLFVTFHKELYSEFYNGLDQHMDKVTFVAVNPTRNKDIPERLKHRVIKEWELDNYDPSLQDRGYNESSTFYHVYRNALHSYADYIGFFQYDMTIDDTLINKVISDPGAPKTVYFQSMWLQDLSNHDFFNGAYFLKSYNEFFGTNHDINVIRGDRQYVMCASFIVHRQVYMRIAPWICSLIQDPNLLTYCEIHFAMRKQTGQSPWIGNVLERAYALALFLEPGLTMVPLASVHSQDRAALKRGSATNRFFSRYRLALRVVRMNKQFSKNPITRAAALALLLCNLLTVGTSRGLEWLFVWCVDIVGRLRIIRREFSDDEFRIYSRK